MKQINCFRTFEIFIVAIAILFIISLTASLLFHRSGSENTKVKSAILAISAAIKNYDNVYGSLPCETDTVVRLGENNPGGYDRMMELLTGIDGPDKDSEATRNSKQINFLYTFENYKTDGWVDEWKTRYNIILNSTSKQSVKIGKRTMLGSIFVYSSGENKRNENGGGDDIAGWK